MKRSLALAIVGLLAFASVAVASLNGSYSGRPSEGSIFDLYVSANKVTEVHYVAEFDCAGIHEISKTTAELSTKISHGKFSASEEIGTNDHLKISGKFSARKVTGSFLETFKQDSAGTIQSCTSGTQTYSATK